MTTIRFVTASWWATSGPDPSDSCLAHICSGTAGGRGPRKARSDRGPGAAPVPFFPRSGLRTHGRRFRGLPKRGLSSLWSATFAAPDGGGIQRSIGCNRMGRPSATHPWCVGPRDWSGPAGSTPSPIVSPNSSRLGRSPEAWRRRNRLGSLIFPHAREGGKLSRNA